MPLECTNTSSVPALKQQQMPVVVCLSVLDFLPRGQQELSFRDVILRTVASDQGCRRITRERKSLHLDD